MICIYCSREIGLNQQYFHSCISMQRAGATSLCGTKVKNDCSVFNEGIKEPNRKANPKRFEAFLKELQSIMEKHQVSFNGSYSALWLVEKNEFDGQDDFVTHLMQETYLDDGVVKYEDF